MPRAVAALVAAAIGGLALAGSAVGQGGGAAKPDRGSKIHRAWPHKAHGKKPHSKLARRLARQVGPIKLKKPGRGSHRVAIAGAPSKRATAGGAPGVVGIKAASKTNLLLVRSFDIPVDDPHYASLSNYSWTYDNALATIAFVADDDRSQARELLDQLSKLQNDDGSINFAFDVTTGGASPVVRSGAVAWVGLAGAAYRARYKSNSYDKLIGGALDYLLKLRDKSGLIAGGPDVSWVSTQHNLLAAELIREIRGLLKSKEEIGGYDAAELATAQSALDAAITSNLLVDDGKTAHFAEGLNDPRIPIDVQALGTMHLLARGEIARAGRVGAYMLQDGWYVAPRTTKFSPLKVSGLRPFLDANGPDVIWTEGTVESQFALTRFGLPATRVAFAVDSLAATAVGKSVGPLGADRDSDSSWGEYRPWPTSAASSWLLMLTLQSQVPLFAG